MCIPFFLLNSREYAKNIKYQRIITNYVARNTKSRIKSEQIYSNIDLPIIVEKVEWIIIY